MAGSRDWHEERNYAPHKKSEHARPHCEAPSCGGVAGMSYRLTSVCGGTHLDWRPERKCRMHYGGRCATRSGATSSRRRDEEEQPEARPEPMTVDLHEQNYEFVIEDTNLRENRRTLAHHALIEGGSEACDHRRADREFEWRRREHSLRTQKLGTSLNTRL